jgi:hypothetical protein
MKLNSWHTRTFESLERELGSDIDDGLTEHEAEHRLTTVGPNELTEAPPPSPLKILVARFSSLIAWVLIGAAFISGLLQEWIDAAAIVAIASLECHLRVRPGVPRRTVVGSTPQTVCHVVVWQIKLHPGPPSVLSNSRSWCGTSAT